MGQFTVGGSASTIGSNCYQLTPAQNSQAGYVYQNAAINLNDPFDYQFSVYLGATNAGADGIVFVLRPDLNGSLIGTGGGAIGFQGSGFTNSIGVEVDTWFNGGFGDIAADHIGILKNGTVNHNSVNSLAGPIQASSTLMNIEDANFHTLNIRWDPSTTTLEVYLDCDYRLQYVGDLIDSIFLGDSLVHWGFLGTTGGANNVHQFCFTVPIDSLVVDLEDKSICAGDTVHLLAGSNTVDYDWSPSSGLSSTTSNKPVANPTVTTTYVVTATYNCDTIIDSVTVTVLDPGFAATANLIEPLCKGNCNASIDATFTGGSGAYAFLWSTSDTTEDISGLCAATYSVTVTDTADTSETYLCTKSFDWTISEPDKLFAIPVFEGTTSCPDGSTCDAQGEAMGTGGTTPYTYLWSSGETGNQVNQLCADTNWVSIMDDQGCQADTFLIIDVPDSIVTTGYGDTLICISNTAAMAAASTGGTAPYSYIWREDSLTGNVVSTAAITNVSPIKHKRYFVSSIDSRGCIGDTSQVYIRVRPELGLILPDLDTICPYDTTDITIEGVGGDSNYSYAWSTGEFGSTITVSPNLSRWYTVTVGDVCGTPEYVDSVFQQVGGYSPIQASVTVEDDSICAGESVYLIANGIGGFRGPKEYRYAWSHTDNKNNIQFDNPLKTTRYIVTITDLCLSPAGFDTVTIYLGKTAYPDIQALPNEACARTETDVVISNTKPGYYYRWNMGDGQTIGIGTVDSVLRHVYDKVGCFDLNVNFETEFGCEASKHFPCAVKVLEQPEAKFSWNPEAPSNIDPFINFNNESERLKKLSGSFLTPPWEILSSFSMNFTKGWKNTLFD
ncbi:MAG: hypothetical protein Salg2KO_16880 [Salibacteraceae bacterium]